VFSTAQYTPQIKACEHDATHLMEVMRLEDPALCKSQLAGQLVEPPAPPPAPRRAAGRQPTAAEAEAAAAFEAEAATVTMDNVRVLCEMEKEIEAAVSTQLAKAQRMSLDQFLLLWTNYHIQVQSPHEACCAMDIM
jgi:hypothetical protein